jgi:S-formylglutathione hydrolase
MALICPDTSPRGFSIPGDNDSWDFGLGAGFYVDSTVTKWKPYQMYSYINTEFYNLILQEFPLDKTKATISGHSMGGHGALISALKNPGRFQSVSAFAPICNPIKCAWGKKAFGGYLGDDENSWKQYDATELAAQYNGPPLKILIDQGSRDQFLIDLQLLPENFLKTISSSIDVQYRLQEGYDHSYWFIQSFSISIL